MAEGSVMGSGEGAFVADDHGDALAVVGEALEDPGEAVVVGHVGAFAVHVFAAVEEVVVVHAGFDIDEAAEAPAGGGHGGDELEFDGVLGLEAVDVAVEEELVVGVEFVGEDDVVGGEAVAAGVLGGFGFAPGGDGASGLGSVGAGGVGWSFLLKIFLFRHGWVLARRVARGREGDGRVRGDVVEGVEVGDVEVCSTRFSTVRK